MKCHRILHFNVIKVVNCILHVVFHNKKKLNIELYSVYSLYLEFKFNQCPLFTESGHPTPSRSSNDPVGCPEGAGGGGATEETQQLLLETWQEVEAMEEKWSGLSPPPTLQ